ncbi:hypothetical protein [Sphingomonas sp.]|uniref:hypothetical protein n=1 Tax=Sphingomonas sp. TaxID=28214 RepID=UPI0025E20720|nr:hypothetical protein [Sphingomonas sp.]MBV9529266.1 hypothetical protein [Sphingomonas sp.]
MDEDVVANIRARIERCRRLAASTTDRQVAAMLLQMAEEGDADLARLEADGGSASQAARPD